jgi:hypothetical protein
MLRPFADQAHRRPSVVTRRALLCCLLMLSGCTSVSRDVSGTLDARNEGNLESADCSSRLTDFEAVAQSRGATLSEPRPVPGYPALASSRLLASFDPQRLSEAERESWLGRLLAAGSKRREMLAQILDDQDDKASHGIGSPDFFPMLDICARSEVAAQPRDAAAWESLFAAVQVPDDYLTSRRIFGLYPLAVLPVKVGVRRLHAEIHATFAQPLAELPVEGQLQRYAPITVVSDAVLDPVEDALGPLATSSPALESLLARYAPIWEIDTAADYDLPGRPFMNHRQQPGVDGATPVVFRYPSLTRFGGVLRLQLNYLLWFDRRPATGVFDSLAGRLDGLLWRVTLDQRGEALVYDSVHPCGCYHLLFPDARLRLLDDAMALSEPPLVPQQAPRLTAGERLVLRISSGEHYIQRVYVAETQVNGVATRQYAQEPYRRLYSTPHPDGPRSLFGADGIVPGTSRGESIYLWPMGIRAPGAMRERGRHATAFAGRRHFDDPYLLEQFFQLRD